MKNIALFLLTSALSCFTLAEFEIPNQFEDGQVTSAAEMNANFQAIKAAIDTMSATQSDVVTFQGFSNETVPGNSSGDLFAKACHDLVPESRVCLLHEIFLSPFDDSKTIPSGHAWLYQEKIGEKTSTGSAKFYKYSGCPIDSRGHYIYNGKYSTATSCTSENNFPVACCK
jgi:hypothetical protein